MSIKYVNDIQLNADLKSIADAIRTKGSTSASLSFPAGFISAIGDISGGGGTENEDNLVQGTLGSFYSNSRVSSIGAYAFATRAFSSVEFAACTSVGRNAFMQATNLISAVFPNCIRLSSSVFSYCNKLTDISFPEVTTIAKDAFNTCTSLVSVSFPKCITLSDGAFQSCTKLTNVYFPSVTSIGSNAFLNCSSLFSVDFPSCTHISQSAFNYCKKLESADFPVCRTIESYAFNGCNVLSDISFPVCTSIMQRTFGSCSALTVASFPSLRLIGSYAFSGCTALESLYLLGSSVCSLSANAFTSTPMQWSSYLGHFGSIFVPASLVDTYKSATNWVYYSSMITAYTE